MTPFPKASPMPQALTLAEARAFLRVSDASEDALLTLLIDAAEARVASAAGVALTATSPAPGAAATVPLWSMIPGVGSSAGYMPVPVLILAAHAYEHRESGEPSLSLVEPWLTPYRKARL